MHLSRLAFLAGDSNVMPWLSAFWHATAPARRRPPGAVLMPRPGGALAELPSRCSRGLLSQLDPARPALTDSTLFDCDTLRETRFHGGGFMVPSVNPATKSRHRLLIALVVAETVLFYFGYTRFVTGRWPIFSSDTVARPAMSLPSPEPVIAPPAISKTVTLPVVATDIVISGCAESATNCKCFDTAGRAVRMSETVCREFLQGGPSSPDAFFVPGPP